MNRKRGAAIGLAAVVLVGGGTWWAVGAGGDDAPGQPSGPSPDASESAAILAPPGEVTSDLSLPSALPRPDGIWEQTGPGWVLATYRGTGVVDNYRVPGPQVVYLVAPTGERYQVAELPTDPVIRLEAWAAGATTATVLPGAWDSSGTWSGSDWSTLDLTTGEVTSNGWTGLYSGAQFVDVTEDGTAIWSSAGVGTYGVIDSSGTAVAYDYTGPRQPLWVWATADPEAPAVGEEVCQTAARYDADSVLELCATMSDECCDAPPGLVVTQDYRYVRRWTDGSGGAETIHQFTNDDPAPSFDHVAVSGDRVVFEGSEWRPGSEPVGAFVLEDGEISPLAGLDATGHPDPHHFFVSLVGDSVAYTEVGGSMWGLPRTATTLVRTDLDSGAAVVLFPYPVPDQFGDPGAMPGRALMSYIILDAFPAPLKAG